jgi:3-dehydroquinate dehydratase-2
MMKILILNGPNLNTLGTRQPEIYGNESFDEFLAVLKQENPDTEIHYYQSNHEGRLIDFLQESGSGFHGILLNAGGLSHTSVCLADAVAALSVPVLEIHISHVFARESFRHHSFLSPVCKGLICGLGLEGYRFGIQYFKKLLIIYRS